MLDRGKAGVSQGAGIAGGVSTVLAALIEAD